MIIIYIIYVLYNSFNFENKIYNIYIKLNLIMSDFYMTQQLSRPFIEKTINNFSKTNGNFNPFGTFKSQDTNFTTFQKTNRNNLLKDENIYNIIKLQYTIVSDFLSKLNLNYTLDSFNSEIKSFLNPTTSFTSEEMSEIININNNDFNTSSYFFSGSLKNNYLYYLITSKSNIYKASKGVQTINSEKENNNEMNILNSNPNLLEDINEKLKKIDEKYEKMPLNFNLTSKQKNNLESKYNRFKRELNEKYNEDLQSEIERIKTMETGKVIIEQNQKYLEKIEKIRNEYENKYELKVKEMNEKQKALKEKENKLEMEMIEKTKELLSQYQQKIENLSKKEEAFNQKCIKELNDIKEQKKELDKKDRELFILKKDYHKELQNEIDKLKNEFKEIFKEQLRKIYNEKEEEIEKIKNELHISKMKNKLNSSLKSNTNKANEECLKNLIEIKENLKKIKSEIKEKKSALNKRFIPLSDNEEEKARLDISYYDKINELESRFNLIVNKFKYKHYNNIAYKNKSFKSDLIVRDENIQKKLDDLEKMESDFKLELDKEFKKFKEDIPEIILSKEEIEKIHDNKYKIVLSNMERERQLNELLKEENEKENALNKVKYINEINKDLINRYDATVDKGNYIIIDKNEMDNQKMFLKYYREKREQQIREQNLQKENLIKNLELLNLIKKEKHVKIKEKDIKQRDKKDEEKSQFSKSIALPPVKNPKEKKLLESAQADEIEELIQKSKIRIAESKEKSQLKDRIKLSNNSQEEDEYGSGDFYDISNEDKKSKKKNESSNKTNRILSSSNKENLSDSYNDFETTKALNKQGIHSEISQKTKSNEDSKF